MAAGDPPRRSLGERAHDWLDQVDELAHIAIGGVLGLLALCGFVYVVVGDMAAVIGAVIHDRSHVLEALLGALNDLLFVVIILELMRTVTAHLKEHTFALRPFLTIGIIAAVRHVLIVGARMTVGDHAADAESFRQHLEEIALNGALTLGLVGAYWLIKRSGD